VGCNLDQNEPIAINNPSFGSMLHMGEGIDNRWLQGNAMVWEKKNNIQEEEKFDKYNRVIANIRKTQHRNPEFGHTQGEPAKKVHY